MTIRHRIGRRLRFLADRIDYPGAMKYMSGYSFTFEHGEGIRWRSDGKGCPLTYPSDADYERAHAESDSYGQQWADRNPR